MGLHNHERHEARSSEASRCVADGWCVSAWPCYCCLAAEVEALRAQVQAVRDAMNGEAGVSFYWPTDDPEDRVPIWISLDVLRRALDGDTDA